MKVAVKWAKRRPARNASPEKSQCHGVVPPVRQPNALIYSGAKAGPSEVENLVNGH
jgi:hypothetical protein